MHRGAIEDDLRRVEPEAVEVVLVDPVARVLDEVLAASGLRLEVDRLAPLVQPAIGEVAIRQLAQVIAARPEVVVDDVEDHAQPERMGPIDERAEVVRSPVEPGRGVEIDAVVTPAEATGELCDGHQLEERDPDVAQVLELARRARVCALRRERPDVELVDDLSLQPHALPRRIRPAERRRIDDLRRTMRPLRLEARRRVGDELVAVEAQPVERARAVPLRQPGEVPGLLTLEAYGPRRLAATRLDDHLDLPAFRSEDAEMRPSRHGLSAYR